MSQFNYQCVLCCLPACTVHRDCLVAVFLPSW